MAYCTFIIFMRIDGMRYTLGASAQKGRGSSKWVVLQCGLIFTLALPHPKCTPSRRFNATIKERVSKFRLFNVFH